MEQPQILVTGGAGYIGSHTCQLLAQKAYLPVTVDNLVYGHEWANQWGPLYRGDLGDEAFLASVFAKHRFSAVLHFAAYAYVGESVQNPLKYYENNVAGSISLLKQVQNSGVERFVFSSTCASYGIPERMPIDESFPQVPVNPYGQSKLMIEKVLMDLTKASPLRAVALRYFNASGADRDGKIGEDHNPETHLIPLALEAAYGGHALTVFGEDYETPDGTCVRDYIHIVDLAEAHVQAMTWMEKQTPGFHAFNLGTGIGSSVLEIINMVEKVTGRKVHYTKGARRPGDPPRLVASYAKAKRDLGWTPQRSDLESIIRTADLWYRKHFLKQTGETA